MSPISQGLVGEVDSDVGSLARHDLAIGVYFSHLGRGGFRLDSDAGVEGDGVCEVVAALGVQLDLMSGLGFGKC
jgi:hypothetical protein